MKEYRSFGYDKLPPGIALLIMCFSFAAYTEIEKYSVVSKEFVVNNFVYILFICTVLLSYTLTRPEVDTTKEHKNFSVKILD